MEVCPLRAQPSRPWVKIYRCSIAADTNWLTGPDFLSGKPPAENQPQFDLVEPESDSEIRSQATVLVTEATQRRLGTERFERFSKWTSVHLRL